MNHFKEEDFSQLLCESIFLPEDFSSQHKEKIASDCIRRLKNERLKQKRERLHDQRHWAPD
jgi:hypothetical protein